jgi:hypothetical protein
MVDCRFHHAADSLFLGWTQDPADDLRCYQYNVTLNGKPVLMNADKPFLTVDMSGKPILHAYRFEHAGEVVYNTYNLLRGDDDWDPMAIKEKVAAGERKLGVALTDIPTYLHITPVKASIESSVTDAELTAALLRFGNYQDTGGSFVWAITPHSQSLVTLAIRGNACRVEGINTNDATKTVVVTVAAPSGLQAAAVLTVSPKLLEAPPFTLLPQIRSTEKGALQVHYALRLEGRADESLITWYRCTDATGNEAIPVAVTRLNQPEYTYALSPGDVGYYIMATVAPKHLRSPAGKTETAITAAPVTAQQIVQRNLSTDFQNFPTAYQPALLPGFWTVDNYKPAAERGDWQPLPETSWTYGAALNGAKGTGLLQIARGARLLYTPVEKDYGDMSLTLHIDPNKLAGQGFSLAGQYMDIYIKFDTRTLTGYALRIVRTLKSDKAVDFYLVQYANGTAAAIGEPVTTVCYRTNCTITLTATGEVLTAHAESPATRQEAIPSGLSATVDLSAQITPNAFGGIGVLYNGSAARNTLANESGSAMFHRLEVLWK